MLDFALRSQDAGNGLQVLSVGGEVDLFSAPKIKRAAVDAIERGATSILIDLSDTHFLDSTALGVLIGIAKRLRPHGGDLVVVNTDPSTATTFTVTGVSEMFPVVDTRAAALDRLNGGPATTVH